ncbi:MAG: PLP-dependent aminotransferase family protein [Nonomuraea sp.]|nr:PLP-dependent aminotransferase family protein [Nonomuraea sp.]
MTVDHLAARLSGWQESSGPLYVRLAGALRTLAETGTLSTGARLPSERALAEGVHVSRTTVSAAYARLRDDGWLVGRRGAAPRVGTARPGAGEGTPADPLADLFLGGERPRFDLTLAGPAAAPAVREALARPELLLPEGSDSGYRPGGLPALAEAIARKLRADGIAACPEEIVVTNGAQQALALAAEALRGPRRPVALEAVTYPGIIDAVRRHDRGHLVALPVEEAGLDVEAAARLIRATSPAAVYLTTFQNPTGRALGPQEADVLLAAAEAAGTPVVEDRVLADLPLDGGRAPVPLAALRPGTAVVTVGSLSKVFWGGLRIGWIHTNRTLAAHLRSRRRALDLGGPAPMQAVATWLLEHHYERTRHRRAGQLSRSLAALTDAIESADLGWRFTRPDGGPNLWVRLPSGSAQAFAARAGRRGVAVAAGGTFAVGAGAAGRMLRIPFYLPPDELAAAVRVLAEVWRRQR